MKQLAVLFAFSTVLAFGATARAADMVEAPAVYDWTGFYIGGAQIGADWQWNSLVLGAIADVEGSTTYDDFTKTFVAKTGADLKVHASDDIDWWGTVRGRLGWAIDRVLIYGTGGLAWADVD